MFLVLLAALLVTLLVYHRQVTLGYWQRRGVPHYKPFTMLDTIAAIYLSGTHPFNMLDRVVETFREKGYYGIYEFNKPVLLLWQPELAKEILVKHFSSFHSRGQPCDVKNDPLTANLFYLEGAQWRKLRNKLSPTFTSGNLKFMFPLMVEVSRDLTEVLRAESKTGHGQVDMLILLSRFATDVIGTCAFGIHSKSLKSADDSMLCLAQDALRPSFGFMVRSLLAAIHPTLAQLVPAKILYSEGARFFMTLMKNTVDYREQNKVDRRDFISLLMELRLQDSADPNAESRVGLDLGLMTAQAFSFFVAGVENVAHTAGFCLHQLAHDADLQRRAAEEVIAAVREHGGGQLTYEALLSMELLDRIVKEGLRLWPAIGFVLRKCNRTTRLGDLVIEEGQGVAIPSYSMHLDPNSFPDPKRFDPDRFTEEAKQGRHPFAYLPFGQGPRTCIAERFAVLEMKLMMATVLSEFRLSPSPRSGRTQALDPRSLIPSPKQGFWVCMDAREYCEV